LEHPESGTKPFENVRNQIGFCGIWCGSCVVGNGALVELTSKYQEVVKNYGLDEWGPKDFDFKEFTRGLTSISSMALCQGCLKGGGRDNCEIRSCASRKNISDCGQCDQPLACKNLKILQHMRTGAQQAGLFVNTEKADREILIQRWTVDLKNRWPSCVLFLESR